MASLCREFGISRKTGYKIFERYQQCGVEGLSDRTRRPFRNSSCISRSSKSHVRYVSVTLVLRQMRFWAVVRCSQDFADGGFE